MRGNLASLGSYAGLLVLLIAPIALALDSGEPLIAVVFEPLVIAWVLVSILPSNRRVEMRSSIDVAASPDAAFALVSDPNNWHRYFPELEVVGPVDLPVRVGTVIHSRLHSGGSVLDAEEVVTAYEPGRRFATAIPASPHASYGGYEFRLNGAGTAITYAFRGSLSPFQSALGGWLLRGRLVGKMARRRGLAMLEIKRLLEAQEPAPV